LDIITEYDMFLDQVKEIKSKPIDKLDEMELNILLEADELDKAAKKNKAPPVPVKKMSAEERKKRIEQIKKRPMESLTEEELDLLMEAQELELEKKKTKPATNTGNNSNDRKKWEEMQKKVAELKKKPVHRLTDAEVDLIADAEEEEIKWKKIDEQEKKREAERKNKIAAIKKKPVHLLTDDELDLLAEAIEEEDKSRKKGRSR